MFVFYTADGGAICVVKANSKEEAWEKFNKNTKNGYQDENWLFCDEVPLFE